MILAGTDIETTGLEQAEGHRIIEFAALLYDAHTEELVDKLVMRIDPKRPIDPGAQAVHGIAYTDLVGCATWEDVAPTALKFLDRADLMICHNVAFDGPFIAGEMARVGQPIARLPPGYCTMENGRWATFDGKNPKLAEICLALGVDYDSEAAHAAEYDVDVMMQCYFRAVRRGFYRSPVPIKKAA